ncbi:MAG: ABC transporter permease, partial [Paracoccaceae bacterium]
MASTTEQTGAAKPLNIGGVDRTGIVVVLGLAAISVLVFILLGGEQVFPEAISTRFAFADWINQAEDWLKANYRWFTRAISGVVGGAFERLEEFLWFAPWPAVVAAMAIPALAWSGLRLAIFTTFSVMIWGAFGMWDDAMTTLAMMIVSVTFCIGVGGALGVLCAGSDRIEAAIRPVLDTMQVMPAFVYLIPAIFFFGLGPASACAAIVIYALPPMIRLTNLGLRQVPPTLVEAAESFGATRWQMLWKVQVPQAMPSILLGVNQTIMMALAVAVFATFVGGGGLGDQVWRGITKLKVGWALEGGLCIVTMAIIFDRLSQAASAPPVTSQLAPGEMHFRLLPQS